VANKIVGRLAKDASGIKGTGRTAHVAETLWIEIEFDKQTGWASAAYLRQANVVRATPRSLQLPAPTVPEKSVQNTQSTDCSPLVVGSFSSSQKSAVAYALPKHETGQAPVEIITAASPTTPVTTTGPKVTTAPTVAAAPVTTTAPTAVAAPKVAAAPVTTTKPTAAAAPTVAAAPDRARREREANARALSEALARAQMENARNQVELARTEAERAQAQDKLARAEPAAKTAQPSPAPSFGPKIAAAARPTGGDDARPYALVPVFFGTNRKVDHGYPTHPAAVKSERGDQLAFGAAVVTIPKSHVPTRVERPWRWQFFGAVISGEEDPRRHFTVLGFELMTHAQVAKKVADTACGNREAQSKQALIFVHGFAVDFHNAVFRTAQLVYDLRFAGTAFLYSWPSSGSIVDYRYDRESAEGSARHLGRFIQQVATTTGVDSVFVVAHSMGSIALLRAVETIAGSPSPKIAHIIYAAPDFETQLFSSIVSGTRQITAASTLYASSEDVALLASKRLWGSTSRAGDVGPHGPVLIDGVDTIDVTSVGTDFLGLNHSYYAGSTALLNDIALILRDGTRPPDKRFPILQAVTTPTGTYWRYPSAK
jgi:esterase/lipase superfamily enzyme